jgi:hypothetical protein
LPPAPVEVSLERWSALPGSAEFAAEGFSGPLLIVVESGRYVYQAGRPTSVRRAGTAASARPEPVPAGREVTLLPGDQLVVPAGTPYRKWNGGSETAVALVVAIVATDDATLATWDAVAITGVDLIRTLAAEDRALPGGPVRMRLESWRLAPGASLPPAMVAGVEVIRIEAGTLGLTFAGDRLPYLATPGIERVFTGPRSVPPHVAGTIRAVRNAGDQPLELLVLTFDPVAAGAVTPA